MAIQPTCPANWGNNTFVTNEPAFFPSHKVSQAANFNPNYNFTDLKDRFVRMVIYTVMGAAFARLANAVLIGAPAEEATFIGQTLGITFGVVLERSMEHLEKLAKTKNSFPNKIAVINTPIVSEKILYNQTKAEGMGGISYYSQIAIILELFITAIAINRARGAPVAEPIHFPIIPPF